MIAFDNSLLTFLDLLRNQLQNMNVIFTLQHLLCNDLLNVNGKEFSLSLSLARLSLSLSRVCVLPGNNCTFFRRDSEPVWPNLSALQTSPATLRRSIETEPLHAVSAGLPGRVHLAGT